MVKKWKYLTDSNDPMQVRIFQIVTFGGILAALGGAITSAISGLHFGVILITLAMGVLLAIVRSIVKKTKKTEAGSCVVLFALNFVVIPLAYFTGGGVRSGISAWFVLGLFVVFLLTRGKTFWVMLSLSTASMIITYIYSYLHPELVIPMEDEWTSYEDIMFSILIVTLIIGLIVRFQNRVYEEERKRVEEQNKEIEKISKSKNRFFANMSHEIRTPINTIIGLNEMILREDVSEEITENAVHIQEASKMLLALINDILDLSKLESGKMEIVPVQYETGTMFSELVNIIWIRAHEKKLEFKVDIDPNIPSMLYGDVVRIKQIVTNLLSNAVKYTQKGYVILTARSEMKNNNRVVLTISVKDSGIGIKKEDMNSLFHSFRRVDEGTNAGIEGTGLGLSISSQLVKMMGGTITVDSIYQKGSIFTIRLEQDIVNDSPMGRMDFMSRTSAGKRKKYKQSFEAPDARVLIVDDNEMNLMVAKKLLRDTKIQVETAKSGKECLELTKHTIFHVIFMDHMMPEMDGVETLKRIRKQENGLCRETPVIALTANVMNGADQIYQDKGFQGYLAKPISGALIEAMLLKHLPKELVEYSAMMEAEDEDQIQTVSMMKKKKIQITTDCICDLPKEFLEHLGIDVMYCYVRTDKARFCDINEINSDNMLEYLAGTDSSSVSEMASIEEYETFFSDALAKGEKVIHICTTQGGVYDTASQAAQGFDNVIVVDSGHLSSGLGIAVLSAAHFANKGRSLEEILEFLEQVKKLISTSFIVPSAEALYRNGRVGKTVKRLCDIFELHPVLAMKKGKLSLDGLTTGDISKCYESYIRKRLKGKKNIDTRVLFITYAGCSVKQVKEFQRIVEKYQKFDYIFCQKASATITSNCGLGSMGILFVKKDVK